MSLTTVDWVALGIVAVAALGGLRRGLIASALSLAGLAAGAYAGSRVGPHLLHGGAASPWTPIAGLVGAAVGAMLLQAVASFAGSFLRHGLKLTRPYSTASGRTAAASSRSGRDSRSCATSRRCRD